jgi:hypothetical protein
MLKSGQTISQTVVDKLNKVLLENRVKNTYPAITTQTLYVNSNGPNFQGTASDDKIYIDCQPTGEEGKELYKETKDIGKDSREQGLKLITSLMESGSVQFILAIVLGIIVFIFDAANCLLNSSILKRSPILRLQSPQIGIKLSIVVLPPLDSGILCPASKEKTEISRVHH